MRIKTKIKVILLLVLGIIAVGAISGALYLGSERFRLRARAYLRQRLETATGMQCALGGLDFSILRGSFQISELALEPRAGATGLVRLQVGEVAGVLGLRTLWKPTLELEDLTVKGLQVHLITGTPRSPGDRRSAFIPVLNRSLNFSSRRIVIREGWLLWNYRRIPIDVSLDDFECDLSHNSNPPSFGIALAYKNGRVVWSGRDIAYALSARLTLLASGLDIQEFEVRRPQSTFRGKGVLQSWESPSLSVDFDGDLDGSDSYLIGPELAGVAGRIRASAHLGADASGVYMSGRFQGDALEYREASFRQTEGSFEIKDKVFHLTDARGALGSGAFRAGGTLQLSSQDPALHDMRVSVTRLPLTEAARILGIPELALQNKADADVRIRWRRGREDLVLDLSSHMFAADEAATSVILGTALAGDVALGYRQQKWDVRQVLLESPHSRIQVLKTAEGRASAQLDTDRAEEVLRLGRRIIPQLDALLAEQPDLMDMTGSFRLDGNLVLELPGRAAYQGHIRAADGAWRIYEADSLDAEAELDSGGLKLSSLRARRGTQSLEGDITLDFAESPGQAPALRVRGAARQFSLDYLRQLGADLPADMAGELTATGTFSLESGVTRGQAVVRLDAGSYQGTGFDYASGEVEVEGNQIQLRDGQIQKSGSKAHFAGDYDLGTRRLNLDGRLAQIILGDFPFLKASDTRFDGRMDADFKVRGTLQDLEMEGSLSLHELRYADWDLGGGQGNARLSAGILSLDLGIRSELGELRGRLSVSTAKGYAGKAEITALNWNMQRTIQANLPSIFSDLSTALQGQVEIEGNFGEPRTLRAQGDLDGAHIRVGDYTLHNQGKIRFAVAYPKLRLEKTQIVGEGSNFSLSGEIPIDGSAGVDLSLQGGMDIRSLPRMSADVSVGGTLDVDVRVTGSLRDPQVIGQAMMHDFRLAHSDLPFSLSSAQGKVTFSRNAVALENIRGKLATGAATINGIIEHRAAQVRSINIQMAVRGARLPYPEGFRSSLDADLTLRGDRDSQVLVGKVSVIRADYLADFDFLGGVGGQSAPAAQAQATNPLLTGLSLNVSIVSPESVYIDNDLARVRARANLTVRGTLAYPSLTGRVEAVEGIIFFRGNRFEITRATADFTELKPFNPELEIRAEADVKRYRLRLEMSGDMNDPRLNLTSDPSLPTVEIVLLMTAGIAREDTASGTTLTHDEMMRASAASLLAAGLTGAVDRRVQRIFGLESFRVEPYWVGSQKDPTARVTVSERLSNDVRVTYSRNLSTNEEQVVIVEYDVSRNLTLVASQDEKGDFGVDIRFRKRLR